MSREIKFICWNGEQMISPDYIDRKGLDWWKENSIPTYSDAIMQFTGLKDCNGKDIFEGDVLDNKEVVVFSEGAFMTSIGALCLSANHREIIGNIYQNPGLL